MTFHFVLPISVALGLKIFSNAAVRVNITASSVGAVIYRLLRSGFLNLFCLVYLLPKDKSIIYPQCATTAFSMLKIKVFFGL